MTPEIATDPRHLMITLFQAERAWALGQELQQEEAAGEEKNGVRHSHMISRLKKAVNWATELETLCAARADARTSLEAEAYSSWLSGGLGVVQSDWEGALRSYGRARAIYDQLATVAGRRQREQYVARSQEIEPSERFCRYNLMRRQGKKAAEAGAAAAAGGSSASGVGSDLASKIQAAVAEQKQQGRGDGVNSVNWKGAHIPIKADKLKAALSTAQDKAVQLAMLSDNSEQLYLEVLSRYDEARRAAASEAGRLAKDGKEAAAADYRAVEEYSQFLKARLTLDRGLVTIAGAAQSFHAAESAAASGGRVDSVAGPDGLAAGGGAAPSTPRGKPKAKAGKGKTAGAAALATIASPAVASTASSSSSAAAAAGGAALASIVSNPWSESPLHQALTKSTAAAAASSGSSGSGDAAAAAVIAAANHVVAWYGRLISIIDEMVQLAGSSGAASSSDGAGGGHDGGGSGSSSSSSLPADAQLLAALAARRAHLAAHRSWYSALAYLHARRFADAAALLGRARERASAALTEYASAVPGQSRVVLPSTRLPPGSDDAALPDSVLLAGLCDADVVSLRSLLDAIAERSVGISATGLLEHLAPAVRADADVVSLYQRGVLQLQQATDAAAAADDGNADGGSPSSLPSTKGQLPTRLVRSNRKQWLVSRTASASTLEPTGDGERLEASLGPLPPLPLPVPVKPYLFDLAFNGIGYPQAAIKAAATSTPVKASAGVGPASAGVGPASAKSPAPKAAGTPAAQPKASPGVLSWLTGK